MGGSTAHDSSVDSGSSLAVMRFSETQKLICSPCRRSVNFVGLPLIRMAAVGFGRKLKVVRFSPAGLRSVTVVRSALLRYTRALNFAYRVPLYSRASMQAFGASGYFARNSALNFSSEQSTFASFAGSTGFDEAVV